jgi:hypothetical protein
MYMYLFMIFSTPQGFPNPTWAKVGQDLRRYADEFQRSKERKKVQKRAAEVIICSYTSK